MSTIDELYYFIEKVNIHTDIYMFEYIQIEYLLICEYNNNVHKPTST